MWLNIIVYKNIEFISNLIPDDEIFDFNVCDVGCFKTFEKFGFYNGEIIERSGNIPYSIYSIYRNSLSLYILNISAKEVWDNPKSTYPFIEMIWFSDCEGGFDTDICKKLYNDFKSHVYIIEKIENDNYFKEFYFKVMELFKLASENDGIVVYS